MVQILVQFCLALTCSLRTHWIREVRIRISKVWNHTSLNTLLSGWHRSSHPCISYKLRRGCEELNRHTVYIQYIAYRRSSKWMSKVLFRATHFFYLGLWASKPSSHTCVKKNSSCIWAQASGARLIPALLPAQFYGSSPPLSQLCQASLTRKRPKRQKSCWFSILLWNKFPDCQISTSFTCGVNVIHE